MSVRVGTSGFSYAPWKGSFYPADLPSERMLQFYAQRMATVEINNSFYRMPRGGVVNGWAAQVEPTFRFSIKAPRRITHTKRLKDVETETIPLLDVLEGFGPTLGTVLFQLPPNFKRDLQRLADLLAVSTPRVATVLEFRNDSWLCTETYELLSQHGAALCITDTAEVERPSLVRTSEHGYLRLRRGSYTPQDLKEWAARIHDQNWQQVFIYFKHEDAGSTELAATMQKLFAPSG